MQRPLVPNQDQIQCLEFVVRSRVEGRRLDQYLTNRFQDYTRSFFKKLIQDKKVTIDGKPVKASTKIRAGNKIVVELPQLQELHLQPQEMPLDIVYEDEYLAVINKEAGLVVHPSRGHLTGTLVNGLLFYFQKLSEYHSDVYRPGIVHRLDRFTTGAIVIAKTEMVHAALGQQFESREVQKEYLALTEGSIKCSFGNIALPLGMDPRNRERMAICHGGKASETDYKVLKCYPNTTLTHIFPKTGRTHQIRIHMKSQGHPLIADNLYDAAPCLKVKDLLQWLPQEEQEKCKRTLELHKIDEQQALMERQALHAWKITFKHPISKNYVSFCAPLAKDFAMTIKVLELIWPNKPLRILQEIL